MTMPESLRMGLVAALLGAAALVFAEGAKAADVSSQIRNNRRDLISASITAPKDAGAASADLKRAMEKVQRIRVRSAPDDAGSSTAPAAEGMAPAERKAPPVAAATAAPQARVGETALSPHFLDDLKRLAPEKVADLIGLADALYLSGHLPEAYAVYEKALARQEPPDAKAWALFQMANCQRPTDPKAAIALYKRLAAEHPKSPWTPVGTVRQQLLEWYGTVRPPTVVTGGAPAGGT